MSELARERFMKEGERRDRGTGEEKIRTSERIWQFEGSGGWKSDRLRRRVEVTGSIVNEGEGVVAEQKTERGKYPSLSLSCL